MAIDKTIDETEDVYADITKDVERRFDTSNYEVERLLLIGKNIVIVLVKNELGGKIMTRIAGLLDCWIRSICKSSFKR